MIKGSIANNPTTINVLYKDNIKNIVVLGEEIGNIGLPHLVNLPNTRPLDQIREPVNML